MFFVTGCDQDCNGSWEAIMTTELLAASLERDLFDRYGPMVAGDELRQALGYTSKDAFRQALSRQTVPVPVFGLPNRRGKFALVKDIAKWLADQRGAAVSGIPCDR